MAKGANHKDSALFVDQWAAATLQMGVYNKMVKQHGSDNSSGQSSAPSQSSDQDNPAYAAAD